MAKVFKVSMYITDSSGMYQDKVYLENELQFDDASTDFVEIEESEEFEWEDELKINYSNATKEDFEAYFNKN